LWVVPTKGGGYCFGFERYGGGCSQHNVRRSPLGVGGVLYDYHGPPSNHLVVLARVSGDVTAPSARLLELVSADGERTTIPIVWVSAPIDAGFFAYEVPFNRETGKRRPFELVLSDGHGTLLA